MMRTNDVLLGVCIGVWGYICLDEYTYRTSDHQHEELREREWEERPLYLMNSKSVETPFWSINVNTILLIACLVLIVVVADCVSKLYSAITTIEEDV